MLHSRPTAVQQAQVDLRTLTGEGLATRYQPQLAELLERKFEVAESDRQEAEDKLKEYPQGSADIMSG